MWLFGVIVGLLNKLIELVGDAVWFLLNLLPNSPFMFLYQVDSVWLNAINWLFPVVAMVAFLEVYVSAVVVYYGLRVALRWVKATGA
ncbi:MAG: hypothetical protein ACYDDH_11990 [Candidatus Desulforudaceae bacterium]